MIALQPLPQPEFHRDFHEHVNRLAQSAGRRESPLPYRVDRPFVEA
jgi:hypothetical protein